MYIFCRNNFRSILVLELFMFFCSHFRSIAILVPEGSILPDVYKEEEYEFITYSDLYQAINSLDQEREWRNHIPFEPSGRWYVWNVRLWPSQRSIGAKALYRRIPDHLLCRYKSLSSGRRLYVLFLNECSNCFQNNLFIQPERECLCIGDIQYVPAALQES